MVVRSTGRALHHASKAVHRLLILGTGLLVLASCLLAGASWRLAQGPIDLGWLAAPIRAALIDDTAAGRVSFHGLALAWEGFHRGVDHPIDLRISDISLTDPTGNRLISAPDAHLTLSLAGLMLGRIVPRTLEVDHGQVAITRETSGSIALGPGLDIGDSPDPDPRGCGSSGSSSFIRPAAITVRARAYGINSARAFPRYRADLPRPGIGAYGPGVCNGSRLGPRQKWTHPRLRGGTALSG